MTLEQLEKMVNQMRDKRKKHHDVFTLENGAEYIVDDAITWLFSHGVDTPEGRIVGFVRPDRKLDPMTESLYEMVDEAIATGGL